jgi:hypothetical protein
MTRRRKLIIGILVVLLVGSLAAAFWPEKPEPVYKGRKLSEWITPVRWEGLSPECTEALEAFGTNSIPYYQKWMAYRPGLLKKAESKLTAKTRQWFHVDWLRRDMKNDRAWGAVYALRHLGERAEVVIPQLLANATNFETVDLYSTSAQGPLVAMETLPCIGRRGRAVFLSLMTNQDVRIRIMAVTAACACYDTSVVTQLKSSLQDPDWAVRIFATNAFEKNQRNFRRGIDEQ